MRREASVAALLLFLLATLPVSPAAAAPGACMDGQDNDGDGPADYPYDPGCRSFEDPGETECDPGLPLDAAACTTEAVQCAGMLPPVPLTVEGTPDGVRLEWGTPLSGPPHAYIVYRLSLSGTLPNDVADPVSDALASLPPVGVEVSVGRNRAVGIAEPKAATPLASGISGPRDIHVGLQLPDWIGVQVPASGGFPEVEAIATVPGGETVYLDAEADPDGAYAYWVAGTQGGCQGPASNAAIYVVGQGLPPSSIGPLEDCIVIEWFPLPPHPRQGDPSLGCLGSPE